MVFNNRNTIKILNRNTNLTSSTTGSTTMATTAAAATSNKSSSSSSSSSANTITANQVSSTKPASPTAATAAAQAAKILSNQDRQINLNALKNQDPFATNILDTASRVAVYKFVSKKNEWKKLDVEGSLFLFERMVEPLHSFVVMNTLALHLFLQPVTADLEFQDRNPFLLYKSGTEIYGIWFIDNDDRERIKNLIINLTENARERRAKREKLKESGNSLLATLNQLGGGGSSLDSQQQQTSSAKNSLLYTQLFPKSSKSQLDDISTLPSLLASAASVPEPQSSSSKTTGDKSTDILQMLTKAKQQYKQQAVKTPGGAGSDREGDNGGSMSTSQSENSLSSSSAVEPKPMLSQITKELFLSSSNGQFVKPEPRRIGVPANSTTTSISPPCSIIAALASGGVDGQEPPQAPVSAPAATAAQPKMNPILQMLMSGGSKAPASVPVAESTINQTPSGQDLFSIDLKRKLNIQGTATLNQQQSISNLTASPIILSSSSMMATPSNPLILNGCDLLDGAGSSDRFCSSTTSLLKRPITLQDFEENLLNESSTSTPSNSNNHQQQSKQSTGAGASAGGMFYLPNDQTLSSSDNAGFSSYTNTNNNNNNLRPSHLTYPSSNGGKKNQRHHNESTSSTTSSTSTSSSSTTSSSSSDSDTDSEPASPTSLPLLLTPAAFESSSASSTTSSSFQQQQNTAATNSNAVNGLFGIGIGSSTNAATGGGGGGAVTSTAANSNASSIAQPAPSSSSIFPLNLLDPYMSYMTSGGLTGGFLFPNAATNQFSYDMIDSTTFTSLLPGLGGGSTSLNAALASSSSSAMNHPGQSNPSVYSNFNAGVDVSSSSSSSSQPQLSLMTKAQLQQAMIHLLNTDDNFLSSLHDAYVKSTLSATGASNTMASSGTLRNKPAPLAKTTIQGTTAQVKVFKQKKPLVLPKRSTQPTSAESTKEQGGPMSYAAIVTSLSNTNIPLAAAAASTSNNKAN